MPEDVLHISGYVTNLVGPSALRYPLCLHVYHSYLYKKSREGKWQKRWFETNGCFLTYYKNRKMTKLLAALSLPQVGAITLIPENDNVGTLRAFAKSEWSSLTLVLSRGQWRDPFHNWAEWSTIHIKGTTHEHPHRQVNVLIDHHRRPHEKKQRDGSQHSASWKLARIKNNQRFQKNHKSKLLNLIYFPLLALR